MVDASTARSDGDDMETDDERVPPSIRDLELGIERLRSIVDDRDATITALRRRISRLEKFLRRIGVAVGEAVAAVRD